MKDCHEEHLSRLGFKLLDSEMFQTRKKAYLHDGCYKKEVKQTNLWRGIPHISSLQKIISLSAEADPILVVIVKSKGPVVLSTLQIALLSDVSEQELICS